jgi:8-oxo-dGTP pyrophosphatase MutT (NUDIX family)
MMPKQLSVGLIITDGATVLLGHTTHQVHWDIPKGKPEEGESMREACNREVWEETGLDVSEATLTEIGKVRYTKRKDLYIYIMRVSRMPDMGTLACKAIVSGRNYPEFDQYAAVPYGELGDYVVPNMHRSLCEVLGI